MEGKRKFSVLLFSLVEVRNWVGFFFRFRKEADCYRVNSYGKGFIGIAPKFVFQVTNSEYFFFNKTM